LYINFKYKYILNTFLFPSPVDKMLLKGRFI